MGQKKEIPATSGIQVLDRAVFILSVIATKPRNLSDLCDITGLPRATAHRIAVALEKHRLIERNSSGLWTAGRALTEFAPTTTSHLEHAAEFVLPGLMRESGESVQLYRIAGLERICIANAEPDSGLHDTVPVGYRMTLNAGSAAKVLVAFAPESVRKQVLPLARYTSRDLDDVRRNRIAESTAERDVALASASVPISDAQGAVVAALSISGPVHRIGTAPAERFGPMLHQAAQKLESHLLTT